MAQPAMLSLAEIPLERGRQNGGQEPVEASNLPSHELRAARMDFQTLRRNRRSRDC